MSTSRRAIILVLLALKLGKFIIDLYVVLNSIEKMPVLAARLFPKTGASLVGYILTIVGDGSLGQNSVQRATS